MVNAHWARSFMTLVEAGGFTRAADRLGLTQAAVSQHLRHLEDEFGPLLIRRPRQIELTPAGQALLEYCQEMAAAAKRMQRRLSGASDASARTGEVSFITPGSVGLALYPLLLRLQEAHPGLVIRHRFAPDVEARQAVLTQQYELGLVTLRPDDRQLSATPFLEEALELVVPAAETVEGWEDLARIGFIDHPDGQAMATRLLTRHLPGNPGVRNLPCRGFSNQIALILEPVARGLGFTVIPRHARQAFARPEALKVVELGPPLVDTLWLIHRAEWPLSARSAWVLSQIREAWASSGAVRP